MHLKDLADGYLEYLTSRKSREDARAQSDRFIAYIGNVKVSRIEVHRVLNDLASKTTWSSTSRATALERSREGSHPLRS